MELGTFRPVKAMCCVNKLTTWYSSAQLLLCLYALMDMCIYFRNILSFLFIIILVIYLPDSRPVKLLNHGSIKYLDTKLSSVVVQLVESLHHKMGGSRFDSHCCVWKVSSHLFLLSTFSSPWAHSFSNRNEYRGIYLGVNCGRRIELKTL